MDDTIDVPEKIPVTLDTVVETPAEEDEEKKRWKRFGLIGTAVIALGAAALLCGRCGYLEKPTPTEEPVPVVVEEIEEEVVVKPPTTIPPIVTEEPVVVDVRDIWLGNYEGTAKGFRETLYQGTKDFDPFKDDELVWLETMDEENCFAYGYCNDNRSWGIDIGFTGHTAADSWTNIRIYLPDDLSDAPGMALTESMLAITPTNEHPYELIIDQVDGRIEGYLQVNGVPSHSGAATEWWIVEELIVEESDAPDPALR